MPTKPKAKPASKAAPATKAAAKPAPATKAAAKPASAPATKAPAKPASDDRVTFSRDGKLVLINAPRQYQTMARFSAAKDAVDPYDTIHLFVDGVDELEKLLPLAHTYKGTKTRMFVVFRHHDRMSASRDAITNAMAAHGYRRIGMISMGESEWGACQFFRAPTP